MTRALLRLAVAAVAIALLARRIDVGAVRAALGAASLPAIVLATVASFAANLVISFRLRALLAAQGVAVGVGRTLAINLSAFFYNLFLPVGGVGVAAIRLQRLSRQSGGRYTAALLAMVCDRLGGIAALALVGLACWAVDPHPKPAGGLLVLLCSAATMGLVLAPRVVPERVRQFAREIHARGGGTWWGAALLRLTHSLGIVARLPSSTLAQVLGLSVLAQLPGIVVFAALGAGLGLTVPPVSMGWVRSVVVLLTVVPISIAGVGVREGALVFMLQPFDVAAHDAIALSILVFAVTILAPGLAGGVVEAVRWLRAGKRRHGAV